WLRPMYFFKEMGVGVLLLSVPKNGKVMAAARGNLDVINAEIQAHGFEGAKLQPYPGDQTLLDLALGNDEWAEAANRILHGRVTRMEQTALKKAPQAVS